MSVHYGDKVYTVEDQVGKITAKIYLGEPIEWDDEELFYEPATEGDSTPEHLDEQSAEAGYLHFVHFREEALFRCSLPTSTSDLDAELYQLGKGFGEEPEQISIYTKQPGSEDVAVRDDKGNPFLNAHIIYCYEDDTNTATSMKAYGKKAVDDESMPVLSTAEKERILSLHARDIEEFEEQMGLGDSEDDEAAGAE